MYSINTFQDHWLAGSMTGRYIKMCALYTEISKVDILCVDLLYRVSGAPT